MQVKLYKSAITYLTTWLINAYETRRKARLTGFICWLVSFLSFDRNYEDEKVNFYASLRVEEKKSSLPVRDLG